LAGVEDVAAFLSHLEEQAPYERFILMRLGDLVDRGRYLPQKVKTKGPDMHCSRLNPLPARRRRARGGPPRRRPDQLGLTTIARGAPQIFALAKSLNPKCARVAAETSKHPNSLIQRSAECQPRCRVPVPLFPGHLDKLRLRPQVQIENNVVMRFRFLAFRNKIVKHM
jgi:hypothetical protein